MKTTTKKKPAEPLTLQQKAAMDSRDPRARHVRLSLSELATMMNTHRSTIWRRIRQGDFPPPPPDGYSLDDIVDSIGGIEVEIARLEKQNGELQAPATR